MKTQLYYTYDSKAEVFKHPNFYGNRGDAIRAFSEACSDSKTEIGAYVEDFSLFHIGELDDSNGVFTPLKSPVMVITGIDASHAHKLYYATQIKQSAVA